MSADDDGGWVARFRDGPAAHASDHVFAVGPIWQRIELAPLPATESRPMHWAIVGGDQIGESTGASWPGQVTYWLLGVDDVDGERVAYYGLDESALGPPHPIPPYLWPQHAPLGPGDLRSVLTTPEARMIARLLDAEQLAGYAMLTQRDGSPWLEVDVVVPFHASGRANAGQEVDVLAHSGIYRFAIWRYTGKAYRVGGDGAVEDDPIELDDREHAKQDREQDQSDDEVDEDGEG